MAVRRILFGFLFGMVFSFSLVAQEMSWKAILPEFTDEELQELLLLEKDMAAALQSDKYNTSQPINDFMTLNSVSLESDTLKVALEFKGTPSDFFKETENNNGLQQLQTLLLSLQPSRDCVNVNSLIMYYLAIGKGVNFIIRPHDALNESVSLKLLPGGGIIWEKLS